MFPTTIQDLHSSSQILQKSQLIFKAIHLTTLTHSPCFYIHYSETHQSLVYTCEKYRWRVVT